MSESTCFILLLVVFFFICFNISIHAFSWPSETIWIFEVAYRKLLANSGAPGQSVSLSQNPRYYPPSMIKLITLCQF